MKRRRSFALCALAVLLAASPIAAAARDIPLPRPRPADAKLSRRASPAASAERVSEEPSAAPEGAENRAASSACQAQLAQDGGIAQPLPPLVGPGGCGAPDVVRLEAVELPGAQRVSIAPAPTLRCSMAQAIVHWVRDEVAPAAAQLGAPLASIENYDSYDCRGRNRVPGAKLSEHGKANALDVRAVTLADGKHLQLTDPSVPRAFRDALRRSACDRFMTVLGPGSDGYHETHVHVDLAERHSGYRMCQWDVRVPESPAPVVGAQVPLPRARPVTDEAANADETPARGFRHHPPLAGKPEK